MQPETRIPLTVYVHLPWCVRKCPYCDFNSHELRGEGQFERYADALLTDLDGDLRDMRNSSVQTLFFGGGTPSLFPAAVIERLLDGIRERLDCDRDMEITLEANPGTVERDRFAAYARAGVNRISLGAQSFDDDLLANIGRIHRAADTRQAVEELERAGLANFNIDLMYALPDQTVSQCVADLEQALRLGPAHVSHYQLTLEPGTVFHRNPPVLPDDERVWEMQTRSGELLNDRGFHQYEVSAFSREGAECRHNLNYWKFGDYIGIGAGAHGKLTDSATGLVTRTSKLKSPRRYLEQAGGSGRFAEVRKLDERDLVFEFMLNALRLNDGFCMALFRERTGLDVSCIDKPLREAENRGLLKNIDRDRWAPTSLGRRFLNDLQAVFLDAEYAGRGDRAAGDHR